MPRKYDIGLLGLAVMGANLARNIARNGHRTIVFNRTTEKTEKFVSEFGTENLQGSETLEKFVESLEKPRKIIIMIKAGDPVDEQIEHLLPLLEKDDILIDCGNSHWPDTVRREKSLREHGILFFGCGVSGGEEGALHGPSIMPGGDKAAYQKHLSPLFEKIAAKDFSGGPCVTWIGEDGAGHYVKMVHNGIEYAVMQMLAEVYDMLRKIYRLPSPDIAAIFKKLHRGKLESFLTEISVKILQKKDDQGEGYVIDKILDKAGQKGTGKWTVLDATERGIAIPSISEAVNARIISSQKDLRITLEKTGSTIFNEPGLLELQEFETLLEDALSAGMLSAYAQGYHLITTAAEEQKWSIDLAEISRIWQGGCIIRARILKFLHETFSKSSRKKSHLLTLPEVASEISGALPAMRMVVATGLMNGVAVLALAAGLTYLENMRQADGSANFLQGLRDFFGAHTFERIDKEGVFHVDWES